MFKGFALILMLLCRMTIFFRLCKIIAISAIVLTTEDLLTSGLITLTVISLANGNRSSFFMPHIKVNLFLLSDRIKQLY